jgi:CheY-like chemotaxis protein
VSKIEQYGDERRWNTLPEYDGMLRERCTMPSEKANLLIVEDDPKIRTLLSVILAESGYRVRSAEDGFSALAAIRNELPNIILSDLNMPGMSGFELLSVVRRRFPAIQVIAMSGVYLGDGIPPGVAADAFYEKGTDLGSLLQIVEAMTHPERVPSLQHSSMLAPIWIPRNGHDASGEAYVIVSCPECLRTFPQVLDEAICSICKTDCVYCHSLIHYSIVQPTDPASPQAFQRKPGTGMPTPLSVPDLNL